MHLLISCVSIQPIGCATDGAHLLPVQPSTPSNTFNARSQVCFSLSSPQILPKKYFTCDKPYPSASNSAAEEKLSLRTKAVQPLKIATGTVGDADTCDKRSEDSCIAPGKHKFKCIVVDMHLVFKRCTCALVLQYAVGTASTTSMDALRATQWCCGCASHACGKVSTPVSLLQCHPSNPSKETHTQQSS